MKKGCGGTGVFLPRHYDTVSSDSRNSNGTSFFLKSIPPGFGFFDFCFLLLCVLLCSDCEPVMLPAKPVYGLKSNIHDLNATSQPRFSKTDYGMRSLLFIYVKIENLKRV